MTDSVLKPCPRCGKVLEILPVTKGLIQYAAICKSCGFEGPRRLFPEDATKAVNKIKISKFWKWHKGPFKLFVDAANNECIQTADGQVVAMFYNIGHEPEDTKAADDETDSFRASIIDALNTHPTAPDIEAVTGEKP